MELYNGPPRDVQVEADTAKTSLPLTWFSPSVHLPARAISEPYAQVYRTECEEQDLARPAPGNLGDAQAFYFLIHGHSMVSVGIGPADHCLVSPCANLEPGRRIRLRDRKGREALPWLIRPTAATYVAAA